MRTTHNSFGLVTMFLVPLWASRTCAVYIPNYILATFCFLILDFYYVKTNVYYCSFFCFPYKLRRRHHQYIEIVESPLVASDYYIRTAWLCRQILNCIFIVVGT